MKIPGAVLLLILSMGFLFSMEWPVTGGIISRNFGWNNKGIPLLGVDFRSDGSVFSAEQGELLFQSIEGNNASRLPPVLGSWLALDHGGGIIGIYSRMDSGMPNVPKLVEKSMVLGESGLTGWSAEKGVSFTLFDRKERCWINPVILVSPLTDSGAPVILSVKLRDSEGRLFDLGQTRTISQGRYTILADASRIFQGSSRNPLAPFRIICSVNGTEIGGLNFETYSARDGVLMVYRNGLVPVRQVFSPWPAFELGDTSFSRGQVTMEVIAQDAEGSSRNAVYRFTVE